MNIVVGSAFRDATGHVARYLDQVVSLKEHIGPNHRVRVIAVEGDSRDRTHDSLAENSSARNVDCQIVKCDHGGPHFGSTEAPERMVALSKVSNAIFDSVRDDDDVLVYIESDLLWNADTIGSLIDMAMRWESGFDIFSPLVFAGKHFYDIWGFRKDGDRWTPFHPFHPGFKENALIGMDSVGSCLVMRREVAQRCRVRNDYALVGWCEDARAKGFRIAAHSGFRINHP